MKRFLLVLVILPTICYGQDLIIDKHTEEVSIIKNCNVDSKTKLSNVKEWIAKTFGDYKNVVQFEDEEARKIILKGTSILKIEENSAMDGLMFVKRMPYLNYTITIECKDDKYRFYMDGISVDVEESIFVLSSPKKSKKQYNLKDYIESLVDGETTNPVEMKDKTTTKSMKEEMKLDSLMSLEIEMLKKKDQKKIKEQIAESKSLISQYQKDILEYDYWINKESRRLTDVNNKILELSESLDNMICKTNEW